MSIIQHRYRVVSTLADTLFGAVHVCHDLASIVDGADPDDALVVLKHVSLRRAIATINAPRPSSQQAPDDPRQEKPVANALRRAGGHRHVVRYRDDFITDSELYFVQDHCAGGDLYSLVSLGEGKGTRRLSCASAMAVVAQVASGVGFLHALDIAHRDLSLENVFLKDSVCQIGDFGLATRRPRGCCGRVGKAYYMPPEVAACEEYDAKAADIRSMGVMLFILLTGSPLVSNAMTALKTFNLMVAGGGVTAILEAWEVDTSEWGPVLDLLAGMVVVDPLKRLSIEQVLEHEALTVSDDETVILIV
ncbi:hypothetical protein PR001_g19406 [Phytophthora rubi]|uniref:Protein kinase domain-containing protein n=1 Tax=Phytophthora rubi TaxID=129364 RepID=A0A6A3JTC3_9STRA|nr:hypothetical protein PR001_g19406 [Phytophthora rubi]